MGLVRQAYFNNFLDLQKDIPSSLGVSLVDDNMLALLAIAFALQSIVSASSAKHYLRLNAVVSDDQDDHSKFECWEMATPFSGYPTVGDSISGLADVANMSYVVLPPNSREGIHRPPHPM